ncbi:NUDIX hydrolase 8-like protein, partial [Tanacetum coccineum]
AEYDRALVSRVAYRDGCLTCQRIPSTTEEISEGAVREVKEEMGVGVKPQMCISIFYLLPNADNALTLFQIDRYRVCRSNGIQIDRYRVCRSNGIQWMPIEEFAAHSALLRDKSRKFI